MSQPFDEAAFAGATRLRPVPVEGGMVFLPHARQLTRCRLPDGERFLLLPLVLTRGSAAAFCLCAARGGVSPIFPTVLTLEAEGRQRRFALTGGQSCVFLAGVEREWVCATVVLGRDSVTLPEILFHARTPVLLRLQGSGAEAAGTVPPTLLRLIRELHEVFLRCSDPSLMPGKGTPFTVCPCGSAADSQRVSR